MAILHKKVSISLLLGKTESDERTNLFFNISFKKKKKINDFPYFYTLGYGCLFIPRCNGKSKQHCARHWFITGISLQGAAEHIQSEGGQRPGHITVTRCSGREGKKKHMVVVMFVRTSLLHIFRFSHLPAVANLKALIFTAGANLAPSTAQMSPVTLFTVPYCWSP